MLYHIENEHLFCTVDDHGAQLHSLKDRQSKVEYLWQGDPAVWTGQAPVLFPIVGRLKDDRYRWQGKEYTLPKHGFAHESLFRVLEHGSDCVSLILESNHETRACYPFEFALTLEYRLEGRALIAEADVENRGDGEMVFSLGGHPGFNCSMGDALRFDVPETIDSLWINDEAMLAGDGYPVLENATDIAIHEHLFDRDALILEGMKSKHVTLVRDGRPTVKFDIGGAPVLGIWAKPGAPYVCIEPWYGLNDSSDFTPDFSQKPLVQRLSPGGMFTQVWRAEV